MLLAYFKKGLSLTGALAREATIATYSWVGLSSARVTKQRRGSHDDPPRGPLAVLGLRHLPNCMEGDEWKGQGERRCRKHFWKRPSSSKTIGRRLVNVSYACIIPELISRLEVGHISQRDLSKLKALPFRVGSSSDTHAWQQAVLQIKRSHASQVITSTLNCAPTPTGTEHSLLRRNRFPR